MKEINLVNKYFYVDANNPTEETFNRADSCLFKIVAQESLVNYAAFLVKIQNIVGDPAFLDLINPELQTQNGTYYILPYKLANDLEKFGKDSVDSALGL